MTKMTELDKNNVQEKVIEYMTERNVTHIAIQSMDGMAMIFDLDTFYDNIERLVNANKNTVRDLWTSKVSAKNKEATGAIRKARWVKVGNVKTWYDFEDAVAKALSGIVTGHTIKDGKITTVTDAADVEVTLPNGEKMIIECKALGGHIW